MIYEGFHENRALDGWAVCLQSAYRAGISSAALRHAIMVHHARRQNDWEINDDWDPWAEWVYCLRSTGLPPEEIARARQAYFSVLSHRADIGSDWERWDG